MNIAVILICISAAILAISGTLYISDITRRYVAYETPYDKMTGGAWIITRDNRYLFWAIGSLTVLILTALFA